MVWDFRVKSMCFGVSGFQIWLCHLTQSLRFMPSGWKVLKVWIHHFSLCFLIDIILVWCTFTKVLKVWIHQFSFTYAVARLVADILAPLVGKNGYALKNSADLVRQVNDCQLDETDVLVSFDVTALFTCVPIDQSLDVIFDKLSQDPTLPTRTTMTAAQVRDLLAICLKTTYFLYDSVIYAQVEGAAMGSPVSPIVANLFMEWFEELAIQTFQYEITIWHRYVDDTMVALCDSLLEDFTAHINSIHPAIQFTWEEECDGTIAMLDADIRRSPTGQLSFSVFRKPTHMDQYLQFSSNQPLQHKLGVIRMLHHRYNTICLSEEAKLREIDHLKKVLSVSGYTKSAWVTATKPKAPTVPQDPSTTRYKGSITLPYVGHLTDVICRTIRKAGVSVHLKPCNTIREPPGTPQGQSSRGLTGGCSVPDPVFRLWCRIRRWDWEEPP